ncbi:MAG: AraC family transcriptional regulator [Oleispira antarctica]|nr:AraC family transcriptional regulator [Oleispira antarctica]MBQ0792845.1 AraC family transcriptional regulator [Oleispira antarctica]
MTSTYSQQRPFLTTDYLAQLITLMKQQGFSAEQVLANTQLNEQIMQQNIRISPMQYHTVVENALSLSQNPLLGIKHGQGLNIASHGFVGFAAMASDNLDQALSLAIRYARTRTLLADIRFHKEDDSAIVQINRLASMPSTFPFVVENIISSLIGVARFLINQQDEMSAVVKLSYSPQAPPSEYERLLGVPVLFNQPHNQVCFPEYLLDAQVSTANATSRGLAESECEKLLIQLDQGQDLVIQVRYQLDKMKAFPTLPVMAKAMNSSPRTINRQLAQLNTTYQHILDDVRREKAIDLLSYSNINIEQVAIQLGYNDPSNFGRAFRRWLGKSPRDFRKDL